MVGKNKPLQGEGFSYGAGSANNRGLGPNDCRFFTLLSKGGAAWQRGRRHQQSSLIALPCSVLSSRTRSTKTYRISGS